MKLTPEQVRQVAEHHLKQGNTPTAIAAFRIASDTGDALSTLFLATFVRDDTLSATTTVAEDAPEALECWQEALDREYTETPPRPVRAREMKRMLAAFAAMATTHAKESA
jgi:hypothetical protein